MLVLELQVSNENEMVINNIEPKTWAEKVGINLNDVVVEINNADPVSHSPAIDYGTP